MREITGGAGVPVVYDSVGKDTFLALARLPAGRSGLMVSFGNASGKVPPFDIGILSQKGSLYLTRPTLATYTATRADLEATAQEVFEVIRDGQGEGRDPAHLPARGGARRCTATWRAARRSARS